MTAVEIVVAVRAHGAEFGKNEKGEHSVLRAKGLPAHLVREVRENSRAVKIELARGAEQLTLISPMEESKPEPVGFWEIQDRRFDALLAEYGIAVAPRTRSKRRVA